MSSDCNKQVPSLFCKLQVGIKPPFREMVRWPQGPRRRLGGTATPAATAASSPSAGACSPPALQPAARPPGSTPGTGVRSVSLALLKVRKRVHVQILAISFSFYQPCLTGLMVFTIGLSSKLFFKRCTKNELCSFSSYPSLRLMWWVLYLGVFESLSV